MYYSKYNLHYILTRAITELSSGAFVTRPSVHKCGNGSLRWLKDAEPYLMHLIEHPVSWHPSFTTATPSQGVNGLFD